MEGIRDLLRSVSLAAATAGDLDKLRCARGLCPDLPWDSENSDSVVGRASQEGHVHVLEWAIQSGSPVGSFPYAHGVLRGDLELLRWAKAAGAEWERPYAMIALYSGHSKVLDWIDEQGLEWSPPDLLRQLEERGETKARETLVAWLATRVVATRVGAAKEVPTAPDAAPEPRQKTQPTARRNPRDLSILQELVDDWRAAGCPDQPEATDAERWLRDEPKIVTVRLEKRLRAPCSAYVVPQTSGDFLLGFLLGGTEPADVGVTVGEVTFPAKRLVPGEFRYAIDGAWPVPMVALGFHATFIDAPPVPVTAVLARLDCEGRRAVCGGASFQRDDGSRVVVTSGMMSIHPSVMCDVPLPRLAWRFRV